MTKINETTRSEVEKRAKYRCEYCLTIMATSTQRFEMEHIIPISQGGNDELENLALACRGCNNHKYNHIIGFDDISQQNVALFNPRKDIWDEHFAWSKNPLELIGLTPKGRVTIKRLELNRSQLLNVRELLQQLLLQPPT